VKWQNSAILYEQFTLLLANVIDKVANCGVTFSGGKIDLAHHEGRAKLALYDTLAFSDAVGMADKMTSEDDTLIVTTADHAHVMSIAGYPSRGNPILGKLFALVSVYTQFIGLL